MGYETDLAAIGRAADAEILKLRRQVISLKRQLGLLPPLTDPAGWTRVFTDDFSTNKLAAQYGNYPSPWQDTSKNGTYCGLDRCTVSNGTLKIVCETDPAGLPRSTSIVPFGWAGQTYGRYSIRMRVSANMPGWKIAHMLWPVSDNWPAEGEIDYCEGDVNGTSNVSASLFSHYADAYGKDAQHYAPLTGVDITLWHIYTLEWKPNLIVLWVDGVEKARITKNVPSKPMRWVLQNETRIGFPKPDPAAKMTVEIDWLTLSKMV